jgi:hypothetical protein
VPLADYLLVEQGLLAVLVRLVLLVLCLLVEQVLMSLLVLPELQLDLL